MRQMDERELSDSDQKERANGMDKDDNEIIIERLNAWGVAVLKSFLDIIAPELEIEALFNRYSGKEVTSIVAGLFPELKERFDHLSPEQSQRVEAISHDLRLLFYLATGEWPKWTFGKTK